jgi:hypothetical protein
MPRNRSLGSACGVTRRSWFSEGHFLCIGRFLIGLFRQVIFSQDVWIWLHPCALFPGR